MSSSDNPLCWICNKNKADSGEHIMQASDIGYSLKIKKGTPFFIHHEDKKNIKIQSIKSDLLKFSKVICSSCNNARTQPHDYSWSELSRFLSENSFVAGSRIRFNRAFPYGTRKHMRNVQLHFVKKLGCAISDYGMPIDISTFSSAIMENKLHPNIYLGFATRPMGTEKIDVLVSDLTVISKNGVGVFVIWPVFFKGFTLMVMYIAEGEERAGKRVSWNPRFNPSCTTMIDADEFIRKGQDRDEN